MGLIERLFGTWKTPRDLLADLAEDYRAEATQAAQLREQADRARYPQAAAELRRLAEMEERHASWLRERLLTLGAPVPPLEPGRALGDSQWQRAVGALHHAQAKRRRMMEQIVHWDPEEPEAVELLRRIEREDSREQPTYDGIIMRSDPQALD